MRGEELQYSTTFSSSFSYSSSLFCFYTINARIVTSATSAVMLVVVASELSVACTKLEPSAGLVTVQIGTFQRAAV